MKRYSAIVCGVALSGGLIVLFWSVGAFSDGPLPTFLGSRRALVGMTLMLGLLPAYLVVGSYVLRRHSLGLIEGMRPVLPLASDAERATNEIRFVWNKTIGVGALLGLLMGFMNAPIFEVIRAEKFQALGMSLVAGQMLLWVMLGVFLADGWTAARAVRRLARVADFELFSLEGLRVFTRFGPANLMMIAGALAFAPLQSLDGAFRWVNYSSALLVAIPTAIFLMLWPLWPLHQRIRTRKEARLRELNARVDAFCVSMSSPETADKTLQLESLLAHRDRVRALSHWFLSTDLVTRIVLYLIFPPLAWVAAALVERVIDRFIGG